MVTGPDGKTLLRCSRCRQWKVTGEFNRSNTRRRGYQCWCRECEHAHRAERQGARAGRRGGIAAAVVYDLVEHPGEKYCGRCGEWLPADTAHYYRNRSKYDGLSAWCKGCWKAYQNERNARKRVAVMVCLERAGAREEVAAR